MPEITDAQVIESMQQHGTGFVRALALAARYADPADLRLIKKTWVATWANYARMSEMPPPETHIKHLGHEY
jgi:hypothetical protein